MSVVLPYHRQTSSMAFYLPPSIVILELHFVIALHQVLLLDRLQVGVPNYQIDGRHNAAHTGPCLQQYRYHQGLRCLH